MERKGKRWARLNATENKSHPQWTQSCGRHFGKLSEKTRIPASRLLDEAMEDLLLKYKVITHKEKTP